VRKVIIIWTEGVAQSGEETVGEIGGSKRERQNVERGGK
jgi:hypothetical protein